MAQYFIVANNFTHQIDCFCPVEEHVEFLTFKSGDVIEVTDDRKFTIIKGWYYLILVNNKCPFYIAIDDLNHYYRENQILSILDIELEINYLKLQINKALDTNNKEAFIYQTTKLKELNHLKRHYHIFLNSSELTSFS